MTWSEDQSVLRWDAHTGLLLSRLGTYESANLQVSYNRDGDRLLVQDRRRKQVFLWDPRYQELISTFGGEDTFYEACRFTPNGRSVVLMQDDGTLSLWDAWDG